MKEPGPHRGTGLLHTGSVTDDLVCFAALRTVNDLELDLLTVFERLVAIGSDLGPVDEDVVLALDLDEAITLVSVEPFDGALHHAATPTCFCRGPPAEASSCAEPIRRCHRLPRLGFGPRSSFSGAQHPPATAGIIETWVPSGVGVSSPCAKRTSSSAT